MSCLVPAMKHSDPYIWVLSGRTKQHASLSYCSDITNEAAIGGVPTYTFNDCSLIEDPTVFLRMYIYKIEWISESKNGSQKWFEKVVQKIGFTGLQKWFKKVVYTSSLQK